MIRAQSCIAALIDRCHAAIAAHAEELTALDQAIGDGDHGAEHGARLRRDRGRSRRNRGAPFGRGAAEGAA